MSSYHSFVLVDLTTFLKTAVIFSVPVSHHLDMNSNTTSKHPIDGADSNDGDDDEQKIQRKLTTDHQALGRTSSYDDLSIARSDFTIPSDLTSDKDQWTEGRTSSEPDPWKKTRSKADVQSPWHIATIQRLEHLMDEMRLVQHANPLETSDQEAWIAGHETIADSWGWACAPMIMAKLLKTMHDSAAIMGAVGCVS